MPSEAHGLVRQTVDVDCLIAGEDFAALDETIRSGGFSSGRSQ
ncbi:MAG: hypothetical protein QM796_12400 [Chthoniobacteraceae bacterium]